MGKNRGAGPAGGGEELDWRERKFVAAYSGNARAAARAAGYPPGEVKSAHRLLRRPGVARALGRRPAAKRSTPTADRREREEFLTSLLRNGEAKPGERLRACELLARMAGDFLVRAGGRPGAAAMDGRTAFERLCRLLGEEKYALPGRRGS
ncbi:MAG: hypothetical protein LBU64_12120 [Planctomycetota bacterium]|jgi:hypothetical protein|nr:hypothetical protein [Planctomycetota bacterium]